VHDLKGTMGKAKGKNRRERANRVRFCCCCFDAASAACCFVVVTMVSDRLLLVILPGPTAAARPGETGCEDSDEEVEGRKY